MSTENVILTIRNNERDTDPWDLPEEELDQISRLCGPELADMVRRHVTHPFMVVLPDVVFEGIFNRPELGDFFSSHVAPVHDLLDPLDRVMSEIMTNVAIGAAIGQIPIIFVTAMRNTSRSLAFLLAEATRRDEPLVWRFLTDPIQP